jgi:hypothetical protein
MNIKEEKLRLAFYKTYFARYNRIEQITFKEFKDEKG